MAQKQLGSIPPLVDTELEKYLMLTEARTTEEAINIMAAAVQTLLVSSGMIFFYDTWNPHATIGSKHRYSVLTAIDYLIHQQQKYWYHGKAHAVSRVSVEAYCGQLEMAKSVKGIINQPRTPENHYMNQLALKSAQSTLLRMMKTLEERLVKEHEPRIVG